MNKFDESRVGYGQENPLIKKGAKGYFSDYRITLESHVNMLKGDALRELTHIDLEERFPYVDSGVLYWQFFYVVEEAPEPIYRALSNGELYELLGKHIRYKPSGDMYRIATFTHQHLDEAQVLIVHTDGKDNAWKFSKELLDNYVFADGGIIGKELR